ncbi:MAG: hypothetical protein QF701_07065 [Nitrospinota bacterium]|jgi:hypothetical protein|nr:hypothetical protein [Nitrospinota bacterium]MDP7167504.1 hypothetical protein [Nitrospinota bacterium]MDP7663079.1 hypothetical protein [Nitrospinota bacterium]HJP13145.1 hypothetical protein [Nitrospinota bacterium]
MRRGALCAVLLAGVAAVVSCTRTPLDRAVRRELLPSEANVVVADHCRGCHIHAAFRGDPHMQRVKELFPEGSEFREAKECLVCHDLRLKTIFKKERRTTTRPHGQLIKMSEIPVPKKGPPIQSVKAKEKKKKKWYFFYLF